MHSEPDGVPRCWWCATDPLYRAYHDDEWGLPVVDDRGLFEKICLEGFQSGLSWITVLKKRHAFRKAFKNFDHKKIVKFNDADIERLVLNADIIRHRGKIKSVINNADRAIQTINDHGSLASFLWQFEPKTHRSPRSKNEVAATSPESTAMSKALKKNGWTFVGPTTCYALMQAMGMVNDHLPECHAWPVVEQARAALPRPR
ncbi:DNA-3-methyladenine glycosylase I [Rubripirellula amarantea]|nr:DNA-3-methyladenine glycosylase I [Rubripirellula amarantea]